MRGNGQLGAAMHLLARITLDPDHFPATYALGQLHATLKQWPAAEQAYLVAADLPQVRTMTV